MSQEERPTLAFGARAKRRSQAQRIGKQGELAFETWGVANGLSSQKMSDDYGIDYICQILRGLPNGNEELTGTVLAAQVKSVQGDSRKRMVLDKVDAETALVQELPFVLVGVSLKDKAVVFRFLDIPFAEELANFIASKEDALTLRLDSGGFRNSDFKSEVARCTKPGVLHRLRLRCTELCIQNSIPGSQLKVVHDSDKGRALLQVPFVTSLFTADDGHEDELYRKVFNQGRLPDLSARGIGLHASLETVFDVAGTDELEVVGSFQRDTDGYVALGHEREAVKFYFRQIEGHSAFVADWGLVLSISKAKNTADGLFHHFMRVSFSEEFNPSFEELAGRDKAIRLIKPGSVIGFSPGHSGFSTADWGDGFENLGNQYELALEVCKSINLPLAEIRLRDFADQEFAQSITVLHHFLSGKGLSGIMPGFVLGPLGDDPDYRTNSASPRYFEVPVVLNVKGRGTIIWAYGKCDCFVSKEGTICGMEATQDLGYRIEFRERPIEKDSLNPEAWVGKVWPPIELLVKHNELTNWKRKSVLEFGGRFSVEPIEGYTTK